MDFSLVGNIARFKIGHLVSAEDFADKYHYQVTSVVLLLMLALVSVKQYIFTPIQCWIPPEWHASWEQFAENYCWVQNTYFSSSLKGPQRTQEERDMANIGYYQWVPFILLSQILSFYLPHLLWEALSSRLGTDLNQMVRFASQTTEIEPEKRQVTINYLAREIFHLVQKNSAGPAINHNRRNTGASCPGGRPFFCFRKRSGLSLVIFYTFIKVVYIGVDVLNLYVLRDFFEIQLSESPGNLIFSWTMFYNLIKGDEWQNSGKFPRVTWCDVPRVVVGGHINRSIMCVLPLNMLNEKIFVFLWLWISAGIVLMVISVIFWSCRLLCFRNRRRFVKKYLRIHNVIGEEEKDMARKFTATFMRYDGIFLLKMIALNSGELVMAEIVSQVWHLWCDRERERAGNKDRQTGIYASLPALPPRPPSRAASLQSMRGKPRAPDPPKRNNARRDSVISTRSPENMGSVMRELP